MNRRSESCRECGLCEVERTYPVSGSDLNQLVESVVRNVVTDVFNQTGNQKTIPVGVSARHMHIRQEDLEVLFGAGCQLTMFRDLNQPGEFAANETVTVVGPKRRLFEKIRILGPLRKITQVELSHTDGIYLGMELPHRLSGNTEGSAPLMLIGPEGVLNLPQGGIRAARHIHINQADMSRLGLQNGQQVRVRTTGPMSVAFNNVIVREGGNLNLEMHIDTDEANAAGLRCGDRVELLG